MTSEKRLHWKLARAEYERLRCVVRRDTNPRSESAKARNAARRGLLAAADEALHRALEDACE